MHAIKHLCAATLLLCGASTQAVTIQFDYGLDTGNFFTQDKRTVLNQVASIFENNLNNSLAALNNVNFSRPNMVDGFGAPIPGTALTASHLDIAANHLLIFVGAADLTGSTLGLATVGTAKPNRVNSSVNSYTSGWGGQMVFDTTMDMSVFGASYLGQTMARDWYVDADIRTTEALSQTQIPVTPGDWQSGYFLLNQLDFASTVMHEMGHIFGLSHSFNVNDAMYPTSNGQRSFFDANDWTAMAQRGWQVASTTPDLYQVVNVNAPTDVPEPTTAALLLAGLGAWGITRRRRPD